MKNQATSPSHHQTNKRTDYYQFDVPWLCNWFQPDNNNMNIFFLMIGNIFNYSLASEQYNWNGGSAYAIPPAPPGNISTITGEPIFTQSYINAYNTAFNQQTSSYNLIIKWLCIIMILLLMIQMETSYLEHLDITNNIMIKVIQVIVLL